MRKLLLCLILSAFSIQYTYAQDTLAVAEEDSIPEPKLVWGEKIAYLGASTGKAMTLNGQWASSPNRIPYQQPEFNDPRYWEYKPGQHNYKYMAVRKVRIDTQDFVVLIVPYHAGYWKNENDYDKRQWIDYSRAEWYLLNAEDWKNAWVDTMKAGGRYYTSIRCYLSNSVYNKYNSRVLDDVAKDIKELIMHPPKVNEKLDGYLQFGMVPVKSGGALQMRFLYFLRFVQPGEPINPPPFSVFMERYYQMDYWSFKSFLD